MKFNSFCFSSLIKFVKFFKSLIIKLNLKFIVFFVLVFLQTGTLTLMTLLLTGVIKNNVQDNIAYDSFIKKVLKSNKILAENEH